jgi:hypothetical protein|tara:strand:+ start:154 stop:774 length:621 start_codon:yes stop_codon:yes gene_type:complete
MIKRNERMKDTILVFTFKPVGYMLEVGGSGNWVLNPKEAMKCKYVVCSRNRYYHGTTSEILEGIKPGQENHQMGFLIATIKDVVPVQDIYPEEKRRRWVILFDRYAIISEEHLWDGSRNPVAYRNIKDLGIDPDSLEFKEVPESKYLTKPQGYFDNESVYQESINAEKNKETNRNNNSGLSIREAKKELSKFYGVNEKSIEVIIKG